MHCRKHFDSTIHRTILGRIVASNSANGRQFSKRKERHFNTTNCRVLTGMLGPQKETIPEIFLTVHCQKCSKFNSHTFPSTAGLIFLTDELTNDRYLVDTGATCCIVPYTSNAGPSGPLLKGADGQPIPHGHQAWQPMMLRQTAGLLATTHPGGPAATKLVSFSDTLVSSPSQQEQTRICPGTVILLPCGKVFARPGPAAPSQPQQRRYLQRKRKPPTRIDL